MQDGSSGNHKDLWVIWWPRVLALTGLVLIVYLAIFTPAANSIWFQFLIFSLATGVPIAVLIDGFLKRSGH